MARIKKKNHDGDKKKNLYNTRESLFTKYKEHRTRIVVTGYHKKRQ